MLKSKVFSSAILFIVNSAAALAADVRPQTEQSFRVIPRTVSFANHSSARKAQLSYQKSADRIKFKLLFIGTVGKFPNTEDVIGPLKADRRTAEYQGKLQTTIYLNLESTDGKTYPIEIRGDLMQLMTLDEPDPMAEAVYWGEVLLRPPLRDALFNSNEWSLRTHSKFVGEANEGPDKLDRTFSHKREREFSSPRYIAE